MSEGRVSATTLLLLVCLALAGLVATSLLGGDPSKLDADRDLAVAPGGRGGLEAGRGDVSVQGTGPAPGQAGATDDGLDSSGGARGVVQAGDEAREPALIQRPWSGRVVEAHTGRAVEGALVALYESDESEGLWMETRSDAEGDFELAWGLEAASRLLVEAEGYVKYRAAGMDLEQDGRVALVSEAVLDGVISPWPPPGMEPEAEVSALLWFHDRRVRYDHGHIRTEVENGRFRFSGLPAGAWTLAVDAPGSLVEAAGGIELDPGEHHTVYLEATSGGQLNLKLVYAGTQTPAREVWVSLQSQRQVTPPDLDWAFEREESCDQDGRVGFSGLMAGSHRLIVTRMQDDSQQRFSAIMPEGLGTLERTIEIASPGRVRGRVETADGQPIAGARITVLPHGDRDALEESLQGKDGWRSRGSSAADGSFAVGEVPSHERMTLLATPSKEDGEAGWQAGSVSVGPLGETGEVSGVIVRLTRGVELLGQVVDEAGRPITGAQVNLRAVHKGASASLAQTVADGQGRFAFSLAPVGPVVLEAELDGYRLQRERIEVPPEGRVGVTLTLPAAFMLRGRVEDESGAGIWGLHVRLQLEPGSSSEPGVEEGGPGTKFMDFTNSYGRFYFGRLTRGRWTPSIRSLDWELVAAQPPQLTLPGDSELVLELARVPRPELAAIVGEVWAVDGGVLTDVRIDGPGRGAVFSSHGNRFEVSGLKPGTRRFEFKAAGYVPQKVGPLELLPGSITPLGRIDLLAGTRLTVRVQGVQGKARERARVVIRPVEPGKGVGGRRNQTLTSTGGSVYRAEAVPRGRWRLKVTLGGFDSHSELIEVEDQPAQKLTVRLTPKESANER